MVRRRGTISVAKQSIAVGKRRRNHAESDSTGRREHARDEAGPVGVGEGRTAVERDAGRGGRRDHGRGQVRAVRGAQGVPGRPLRAEPDREGRDHDPEGPEAQGRAVRVGGHRTISQEGGERRGGADRHVPGGSEYASGRRHQQAFVGRTHALPDVERQAQEGVRGHRPMAESPIDGPFVPVSVRGRRVAQAHMGRERGERERARRGRRGRYRPPGGRRRRGGHEGGQGQLGAVHQVADRTRPEGRAPGGRRPVRGIGVHRERDAAGCALPAVHGPLHAQRAQQGQPQAHGVGGVRAQGRVRHGNTAGRPGEGRTGRRRNGIPRPEGRRLLSQGGRRRGHDLSARRIPGRASAADPHEQHDRTTEPRDPQEDACGRQLPGRQERAHAHMRQDPLRHRQPMVHATLPGHVPARRHHAINRLKPTPDDRPTAFAQDIGHNP